MVCTPLMLLVLVLVLLAPLLSELLPEPLLPLQNLLLPLLPLLHLPLLPLLLLLLLPMHTGLSTMTSPVLDTTTTALITALHNWLCTLTSTSTSTSCCTGIAKLPNKQAHM